MKPERGQGMEKRNHEILTKQPLLREDGSLLDCGWARSQMQCYDRNAIKAPKFRIKEWDYYLVMGQGFGIALTISDDGYIGLQSVSLLNFKENWEHTETILNLFPMGKFHLPSHAEEGRTSYADKRLKMDFNVEKDGDGNLIRTLECHFERFYKEKPFHCKIVLCQKPGDNMVISIPWKGKRKAFYYNQKTNCMQASGFAEYDGIRYEFCPETDFGTLDWGRGVWTYDNTWYWGNGNCRVDGHAFGFNIGYGFGDNSAASENIIFYDGKAHKLDDVTFEIPKTEDGKDDYMSPWKFSSGDGRFEMDFLPVMDRAARINALVVESDQHQVFGKMSGRAVLDDGTVIEIRDCMCFAEKVHNRY